MEKTTTAERLANHLKETLVGKPFDYNKCEDELKVFFEETTAILDPVDEHGMTEDEKPIETDEYYGFWTNPDRTFRIKVYYVEGVITDVKVMELHDQKNENL